MSKPLTMTEQQEAAWRNVPARGWVLVSRVRDLWAEVDALRTALAAAEANAAENHAAWERGESERVELRKRIAAAEDKLADCDKMHACQCARVEILLKELADERKHAGIANDILTRLRNASYEFHNEGNHECVDAWLDLYAARRNAEKEVGNG